MFAAIRSRILLPPRVSYNAVKRFFLSNAYKCEEAWSNRLKNPVFSKIDTANMYHELDCVFQNKQRVSVLDVDLLFNTAHEPSFKNEVEDVLLRLRLCPECSILPERATHAAIKYLMEHAPKEDFFNVLSDRLNYGLFPNHYLTNMLMDKYLKQGDACSAVKVAVLQMLQDDLDHPIMKVLALHCCYNYLQSPDIWMVTKDPDPDPDEEPVKVRVRFLRNPYFDDHFDIRVPNHLVGKTLWLFGHSLGGSVGASSQLVGLVLYEKYSQCVGLVKSILLSETKLHEEAVAMAKEYAVRKPKQVQGEERQSEGEDSEHKRQLLDVLAGVDESGLEKGSLLSLTSDLVKAAVKENEGKDIEQLSQMYKQWEQEREEHIKYEVERAKRLKAQEDIRKIREDLEKEEQRLFFFDRLDEIELVAGKHEKQMKSIQYYKPKGKEKASEAEEYIPPTI